MAVGECSRDDGGGCRWGDAVVGTDVLWQLLLHSRATVDGSGLQLHTSASETVMFLAGESSKTFAVAR